MNATEFEKKLETIKSSEVLFAMVRGLRKEWVKVEMNVYFVFNRGVCHGCAATNALCEIVGRAPEPSSSWSGQIALAKNLELNVGIVNRFELGIDFLRQGELANYNKQIKHTAPNAVIPKEFMSRELPRLENETYADYLRHYELFAEALKQAGY